MRLLIFFLLSGLFFSCSKGPQNNPVNTVVDSTKRDSIPVASHVLVLGTTNDSLVVWRDDTMHFLHSHYWPQSMGRDGQMVLSDSVLYIAGGSENDRAVFYKNFVKTTLSPYYSFASTIYAENGHVYVGGLTMDRGDGKNMYETYATKWEDGKRYSYYWENTQFNFITHQDTITTALGLQRGGGYDYGPGVYIKNNERQPLSTYNAEANGMAIKDTVTYIVGNIFFNGWQPKATLWKNGKESYIYGLMGNSTASAIFLQGEDVFISGMIEDNAVYWKNGVPVFLAQKAKARDIKVFGNDVYVAGQYYDPIVNKLMATLWKNGVQIKLSKNNQLSDAFSVVVF